MGIVIKESHYRENFPRGIFPRGIFPRGIFRRGIFRRGIFRRGIFRRGIFLRGIFRKGIFHRENLLKESLISENLIKGGNEVEAMKDLEVDLRENILSKVESEDHPHLHMVEMKKNTGRIKEILQMKFKLPWIELEYGRKKKRNV